MASGFRLTKLLAAALLPFWVDAACASVDDAGSAGGGPCVGPNCTPSDASHEQSVTDVSLADGGADAPGPSIHPLCGSGCLPDDPSACGTSPVAEAGTGDAAGTGGAGGAGGAKGAAGAAGAASNGNPPGETDAGLGNDSGPTAPPPMGCNVARKAGGSEPESKCSIAGSGGVGAPCVSTLDCAPGFACVGEGNTAQCRPYCCGTPEPCGDGTFCAEQPLKEDPAPTVPLLVPVCVQADDCSLSEPFPCPAGNQCKCKDGRACMVVKDDGTTSCLPPGDGLAGDACPCAAGHVCSKATQTCLKICSTTAPDSQCGDGKCQAVAYLEETFGVCGLSSSVDGG